MSCDGVQRLLAGLDDDLLSAGYRAVTVAIRDDHGAAALNELSEAGVIVLGAREHDLAAEPGLWVRLTRTQLLSCLAQVRKYQILWTYQRHELYDVELIARYYRVVEFTVVAYLFYQAAYFVVLGNSFQQSLV